MVTLMSASEIDRIGAARHVNLTTFRADGTPAITCVWVAREGDRLYVLTHRGSGKVARLKRDPRVRLAPSDARGRPQGGQSAGTGRVAEDPDTVRRTQAMLRRRYGPQYRLLRGLMMLRGRSAGEPVAIVITDVRLVAQALVGKLDDDGVHTF